MTWHQYTDKMRLILDQNYQGDQVKRVETDGQYPGLRAGDVIVSASIEKKVRSLLNEKAKEKGSA